MTGNAMRGDRERCVEAGMDNYLSKPIRAPELVEMLESHLRPAIRREQHVPPEKTASCAFDFDRTPTVDRKTIGIDGEQRGTEP